MGPGPWTSPGRPTAPGSPRVHGDLWHAVSASERVAWSGQLPRRPPAPAVAGVSADESRCATAAGARGPGPEALPFLQRRARSCLAGPGERRRGRAPPRGLSPPGPRADTSAWDRATSSIVSARRGGPGPAADLLSGGAAWAPALGPRPFAGRIASGRALPGSVRVPPGALPLGPCPGPDRGPLSGGGASAAALRIAAESGVPVRRPLGGYGPPGPAGAADRAGVAAVTRRPAACGLSE